MVLNKRYNITIRVPKLIFYLWYRIRHPEYKLFFPITKKEKMTQHENYIKAGILKT